MVRGTRRDRLFPDASKDSFRAAAEWEKETKLELQKTAKSETPTESVSIEQWLDEYLADAKIRYVKKTYQEKRGAFDRLARQPDIYAVSLVDSITIRACRAFLSAQFEARSGYAANKDRKNLATAWKWGRKNFKEWPIGSNPFRQVPKFPETRQPRYVPTEDDFWSVCNAAEGQDRVMLLSMLYLAARKGEIFRLTIHDLDFQNKQVRLFTRKRKGGHLEEDWVPMASHLKDVLLAWIKERLAIPGIDKLHVFICLDQTPFCEQFYGKPFKNRNHLMGKLCAKAGVRKFGFHAIRHLTASILYQDGVPVADIQAILRHKSPNTTERYLHRMFGSDRARSALERLSGPNNVISLPTKKVSSS